MRHTLNQEEAKLRNIIRESISAVMKEQSNISKYAGLKLLSEANLNHIMQNAKKNGIIIISASRNSLFNGNPNCDLTNEYSEWLELGNSMDTAENEEKFLAERNRKAERDLYNDIKMSPYSFSKVYGGYKGKEENAVASYEPSYIVYCVDRNGERLPFEELFEFGKELCEAYNQDSFFAQAPGEAPNYYNERGEKVNSRSSKKVKYNREKEQYFTTAKREKGDSVQRFTSDISFDDDDAQEKEELKECYVKEIGIEYTDKIRRSQAGEILLL